MNILTLIDDLANTHACLQAARNDGAAELLRDMGHRICGLNKTIVDHVKTLEDVETHRTEIGMVDLEFKSMQSDIEQALMAEAKHMYGASYAGAQTLRSNMLCDLDDLVLQEKTLRDLLKTNTPPWAARSITNCITKATYTLEDAERVQAALRKTNRISDA